jgi:hypothetical protein
MINGKKGASDFAFDVVYGGRGFASDAGPKGCTGADQPFWTWVIVACVICRRGALCRLRADSLYSGVKRQEMHAKDINVEQTQAKNINKINVAAHRW